MTKSSEPLSRRKLLGRIGVLAAVGYTVPAFTTLSMAQAGSSASAGASSGGASSSGASVSGASSSGASVSGASASGSTGVPLNAQGQTPAQAGCVLDPANPQGYADCLTANGF